MIQWTKALIEPIGTPCQLTDALKAPPGVIRGLTDALRPSQHCLGGLPKVFSVPSKGAMRPFKVLCYRITVKLKPRTPRAKTPQYITGGALLLFTLLWCVGACWIVYKPGSIAVDFHPLVLFIPIIGLGVALVLLGAVITRRWLLATTSILSLATLSAFFPARNFVQNWAWNRSIRQYDQVNKQAIQSAPVLPIYSPESSYEWFRNVDKMGVLPGFQWYDLNPNVAPDGIYRSFKYEGLVFVPIQRFQRGFVGLTYLPDPSDMEFLEGNPDIFHFMPTDDPHWVIWWI